MLLRYRRIFALAAFFAPRHAARGWACRARQSRDRAQGRALPCASATAAHDRGRLARVAGGGRRLSQGPFRLAADADHRASGADQTDARPSATIRCSLGAAGACSIWARTRCDRAPAFSSATEKVADTVDLLASDEESALERRGGSGSSSPRLRTPRASTRTTCRIGRELRASGPSTIFLSRSLRQRA